MDLKFSEISVDTSLAQEYLKNNEALLELYNDYNGTIGKFCPYYYDGKVFLKKFQNTVWTHERHQNTLLNMAAKLKQNATLITQLEYYFRNIPIEDTSAQLNLIIQYIRCHSKSGDPTPYTGECFYPNDPLLVLGGQIFNLWRGAGLQSRSKATAPICHLFITLLHEAGAKNVALKFVQTTHYSYLPDSPSITCSVKGLDSGAVAVVSDDADVDSAVDKFIAVSTQTPWRLRRILVQESVYQKFKDALSWKCNLNKSGSKTLTCDVLCSNTLTYNDRTFLIDPVELTEEEPSVVTVEAYRTTKEMISLVHQDQARYLSLWTNGIAEINEVTHSTKSPVVWVNTVADFRGPPQVAEAVFSYYKERDYNYPIHKCDKVAKLCELSQSWLKLDFESRRDILYGLLDKYILLDPENKLYTNIRYSLSTCTLKSFVDVGKDYVCVGMSQPVGIVDMKTLGTFPSVESFESLLQGNAFIYIMDAGAGHLPPDLAVFEQAGVPVAPAELVAYVDNDEEVGVDVQVWNSRYSTQTRVVWTTSGTIFAN